MNKEAPELAELLDSDGHLKCIGCTNLAQRDNWDETAMAQGLIDYGMKHMPTCPFGVEDN